MTLTEVCLIITAVNLTAIVVLWTWQLATDIQIRRIQEERREVERYHWQWLEERQKELKNDRREQEPRGGA